MDSGPREVDWLSWKNLSVRGWLWWRVDYKLVALGRGPHGADDFEFVLRYFFIIMRFKGIDDVFL